MWTTVVTPTDDDDHATFCVRYNGALTSPLGTLDTSIAHVLFFETHVIKQFIPEYSHHEYYKELRILKHLAEHPVLKPLFCNATVVPTLAICMERYDGDLSAFIQTSLGQRMVPVVLEKLKIMCATGLLYTDIKPQNVIYKKNTAAPLPDIAFCDFSAACLEGDEWSCQTFPYPGERAGLLFHKADYDNTISPANETTVVWNFGIFWMTMIGYQSIAYDYLCYTVLTQRSLRAFKRLKLPLPPGLKRILHQETTRLCDVAVA